MSNAPDKATLIKLYLHLRDVQQVEMRKRHKQEEKELDAQMGKLNAAFTSMFNRELAEKGKDNAQTSIKTPQGRAYRDVTVSYKVTDAEKYKAYLAQDALNRIGMAHARVNGTELEAHLQTIGKVVPRDGVKYDAEPIPGVEAVLKIQTKFVKPT